jgi:hypothetical protein
MLFVYLCVRVAPLNLLLSNGPGTCLVQQLGKDFSATTNTHATIEELLDAVRILLNMQYVVKWK